MSVQPKQRVDLMEVFYSPEAELALIELSDWIEEQNTPGSGDRYFRRFVQKVKDFAIGTSQYSLCHNEELRKIELRCIAIDNWVVAFRIDNSVFRVYRILYGPSLE